MKGKIIAFVNVKSGSGKTTSVINVGACLFLKGYRVLLVDTDPLSSLTSVVLGEDANVKSSLSNVFSGEQSAKEVIINFDKYDILPSDISLAAEDNNLGEMEKNKNLLDKALNDLNYDFILIDTPSSLAMMTRNAVYAADSVLFPIHANVNGMPGYENFFEVYNKVKSKTNSKMNILGMFLINQHREIKLSTEFKEIAKMTLGKKLMKTNIRYDIKVSESCTNHKDIISYDPTSTCAEDYKNLTLEIMQKNEKGH